MTWWQIALILSSSVFAWNVGWLRGYERGWNDKASVNGEAK